MTVLLYKFPENTGGFEASPPCVAIETYFKLAKIEYRPITKGALSASGSKTLPAIEINDESISDSESIIRHFENSEEYGLDGFLSEAQETEKILLWRLMNGSVYQFMVAERWLDPIVYPKFVETFKKMLLPTYMQFLWPILKVLVSYRVRSRYLKSLNHLSDEERRVFMTENFAVLSKVLGDNIYLFGDRPSSADAYLYAYTYSFLAVPYDNPTRSMIDNRFPNLVAYYERMSKELKG